MSRRRVHGTPGARERRRRLQRPIGTRPTRPIVVVVCDDRATSPAYFEVIKHEEKLNVVIQIIRAGRHGSSPTRVFERARTMLGELNGDNDNDDRQSVWAVFDIEGANSEIRQAEQERTRAKDSGVETAVSYPCFELWTLLHLQDTGAAFDNCGQVIKELKKAWKKDFGREFDVKTKIDYEKIRPGREEAVKRARQHWERGDPSRTEVYKVIEHIKSVAGTGGSDNR